MQKFLILLSFFVLAACASAPVVETAPPPVSSQPAAPVMPAPVVALPTLKPNAIKELPEHVKRELNLRKCKVQAPAEGGVSWVTANLGSTRKKDWAVICVENEKTSVVRIVWGAAIRPCPDTFALTKNHPARTIASVEAEKVIELARSTTSPTQSGFKLNGLRDGFVGMPGASIYFCSLGIWQQLTSKD